jgi:hypothetical protein
MLWKLDGVVEGFSCSLEMHGLKCNKLIGSNIYINYYTIYFMNNFWFLKIFLNENYVGNGDSSVSNKLREILPYGRDFFI